MKPQRENVNEPRRSDVSAWDCVPYAGELLQSWFQDSWEVNQREREREVESFNDQKSVHNRRGSWQSTNCSFSRYHKTGLGPNQPESRREEKGQCFRKWEGLEERTGNSREHICCTNQSLSTPYKLTCIQNSWQESVLTDKIIKHIFSGSTVNFP